ncbi:hook-length control protein FliK [Anaerobium acetethylicum]|uniref:Hook-length control protein FliK n=2 Tax=Anaerobium acetethylicum TaxID=1619234 RepID=A0A1D3TPT4_9FIRM|nr:hook-length control protein FliK [Anaerobium acetethylicum]
MNIEYSRIMNLFKPAEQQVSGGRESSGVMNGLAADKIFAGEVIDILNNSVVIAMEGGRTISARLEGAVDLYIGQRISFQVKQSSREQIVISPVADYRTNNSAFMRVLEAAGIPSGERALEMAKAMMEKKMPVDMRAVQEMHRSVSGFPDSDVNSIVSVRKLGLPVTGKNLESFERYRNYEHRIAMEIENLAGKIPEMLESMGAGGSFDGSGSNQAGMIEMNSKILDIFGGSFLPENEAESWKKAGAETGLGRFLEPSERETLAGRLETLGVPEGIRERVAGGGISEKELLTILKASCQKWQSGQAESETAMKMVLENLFGSPEYAKLLKEGIRSSWLVSPGEIADEKGLEELYDRLDRQTKSLNLVMDQAGGPAREIAKQAGSLRDNLDFMNQLNQLFAYIQIPLRLRNQTVHSELYVYTDKKKLAQGDGDISILLHLDMDALGSVDIHVQMSGKNMNMRFSFEDGESARIVKESIGQLEGRLEAKGYHTDFSVETRDKTADYREEFLDLCCGEGSMKKYAFDVRM